MTEMIKEMLVESIHEITKGFQRRFLGESESLASRNTGHWMRQQRRYSMFQGTALMWGMTKWYSSVIVLMLSKKEA